MRLPRSLLTGIVTFCSLALANCAPSEATADVASAMAHPDRPAADAEADERRKPAETLAFAGLQEGMVVFELEAGGGYFTELLSRGVGPEGSVTMHEAPGLMSFVGDGIDVRTGNNRLPNVRVSITNFDDLDAADNSVDMVTWILGPHELGFAPEGVSLGDPEGSFQEIYRILKPGGVFLAVDHLAADGAGLEAGGTVHRIEETLVTQYSEQAGLTHLRSSDILKNPEDPLDNNVFDPSIRGVTSQFVALYQK